MRSTMTGGLGATSRIDVCAVVGCEAEPKPHTCPYDGTRHGHGAIHYWCRPSALQFREGDWFQMCDAHYQQILRELREH